MAPPAACSYGRPMTNAPPRNNTEPRSVTVLGATGSIGTSTVDLLRREPERYRVEALSAKKSAAALAQLARDLGARG
jgi:1-deoxy-D-xylulose-5-phosphate reductoisomerase